MPDSQNVVADGGELSGNINSSQNALKLNNSSGQLATHHILVAQEETELDEITRSIELEVSQKYIEQDRLTSGESIVKEKFDKASNFKAFIQSRIEAFKFETRFSKICFIVPLSDEFDFFAYQIIGIQKPVFEQYRIPDAHAQFFERILTNAQTLAINSGNFSQFERFMTQELKEFIATDSFLIMPVYLMDHPMGIIYAIPEDPDKECSEKDFKAFQSLATHFYKGIETMVDMV